MYNYVNYDKINQLKCMDYSRVDSRQNVLYMGKIKTY